MHYPHIMTWYSWTQVYPSSWCLQHTTCNCMRMRQPFSAVFCALKRPHLTPSVARNASRGVILATRIVSACCDPLYYLKCELRFLLPKCLCLLQPLSLLETQAEKLFLFSMSVSAYHDPSIATSGGVLAIHIVSACYHHLIA